MRCPARRHVAAWCSTSGPVSGTINPLDKYCLAVFPEEIGGGTCPFRSRPCESRNPRPQDFVARPSCQFAAGAVFRFSEKMLVTGPKSVAYFRHPVPLEGRSRSSQTRDGERWTRRVRLTRAPEADGEIVWS